MAGSYGDVGNQEDYNLMDPNNVYGAGGLNEGLTSQGAGYNAAIQNFDPNAYMAQFLGQAGGLSNLVSGQNSQLQQTLTGIAQNQARSGGEAALAAMPGMAGSGAASAAFGQAYANPFAAAQAQLQQNQLQGTLGLWGNAMGLNAGQQQAQLGANTQMAANTQNNLTSLGQNATSWYQPTYAYQPGLWDYTMQGLGALGGLGSGAAGLSGLFSGLGLGGGGGGGGYSAPPPPNGYGRGQGDYYGGGLPGPYGYI